jgi:hypothetical protein
MGKKARRKARAREKQGPEQEEQEPEVVSGSPDERVQGPIGIMFSPGAHRVSFESMVTTVPNAVVGRGAPAVELSGHIMHQPIPGGSYTEIRNMNIFCRKPDCPVCKRMEARMPVPAPASFASRCLSPPPRRRCTCGFAAYTWRELCPECNAVLLGDSTESR